MKIYKIENLVNGKIYIGQTIRSIETRWRGHVGGAFRRCKKRCPPLYKAIRKYGVDNFQITQISTATTRGHLDMLENMYIKYFKSNNPKYGYNLTTGGGGASGLRQSKDHRNKISRSLIGHKVSKETRKKIGLAHKGKYVSKKSRERMSKAHIGHIPSLETCGKISRANSGRILSKKVRKNMSLSKLGMAFQSVRSNKRK